jgi:ribosomal protein L3 glutamine methyltransferase
VPFYVDERAIVPRSLIAELLADGSIDPWLGEHTRARARPVHRQRQPGRAGGHGLARRQVDAADISPDAWPWPASTWTAWLQDRIRCESMAWPPCPGPYDLILCNPPYVNAAAWRPARRIPAEPTWRWKPPSRSGSRVLAEPARAKKVLVTCAAAPR